MKRQRRVIAALIAVASLLVMAAMPAMAQFEPQYEPGNDAFNRTWSRTDLPVKEGEVERTWMWGPWAFTEVLQEPYADSPDGMRDVQYFDKSRMEINNPDADEDSLWYVTNGLLVVEMIEGKYQIGDEEFDESPSPADVQIVGDPGQEFGPTYAWILELGLRSEPALPEGTLINQTINEDGEIVTDTHFDQYGAMAAERVQVPTIDHTVAGPFWEFMNSEGTVWENDEYVTEPLFENAFYATGYPITEAYWATVPVAGTDRDVLWQCFERRCLSYTPGNPEGFLVEAGNVGQHYWTWRYEQEPTNEYTVLFGSLNGSGVDAEGTLQLEGDQLTVHITASGLVPDQEHMQHIHGTEVEFSTCPTPDLDTDEDGIISISEGAAAYGGVVLALEPYPTADGDGNYEFEGTYEWDPALDLTDHTIVIHGLNVEDEYDASVPVACGRIYPADELPVVTEYDVTLDELNDSGASGQAHVSLQGQVLTVAIDATGLTPDQMHMQHIHGVDVEISVCPTPDYDADEDGLITISEGAPAYGGVLVPLMPYPTADDEGNESTTQTYIVDPETVALDTRTIVLHGMEWEGAYDASIPVACGPIGERAEPQEYFVLFGSLNGSGVEGLANLTLEGDQLTVVLDATGYTPEQMHMQHIHGTDAPEGGAVCPDPTADTDGDGLISLAEGGPFYGGVAVPLFSDVEAEEYPMSDDTGTVSFENTFTLEGDLDLTAHVIALHGMEVDGEFDASIPVACGQIVPADTAAYVALDLSPENEPDDVMSDASGEAWFWHDAEGDVIYFMLSAFDLDDATAAHIHHGSAGESGGVVVPLFIGEEETSYAVQGILSTGRITADDLSGDLAGMTLDDLVAFFGTADVESDAYVNVHSVEYGSGVMRDQISVPPLL